MAARLITEEDVRCGRAGDPIVVGDDTVITPAALDRARLLGIEVLFTRGAGRGFRLRPPAVRAENDPAEGAASSASSNNPTPAAERSPAASERIPGRGRYAGSGRERPDWSIPRGRASIDPSAFRNEEEARDASGTAPAGPPSAPVRTTWIALVSNDDLDQVIRSVEELGHVVELSRSATSGGCLILLRVEGSGGDPERWRERMSRRGWSIALRTG